jgi:hypothetical protein
VTRSCSTGGSRVSQVSSARGLPKIAFGWNTCPRRSEIAVVNRAWAASTARSQPEFPAPTTSTRSPLTSSTLRYWEECRDSPVKSAAISGMFAFHRCPFATRTPS